MAMKRLEDLNVSGKRVLCRVDFNVSTDKKTGEIKDDTRVVAALPTITYLTGKGEVTQEEFNQWVETAKSENRIVKPPAPSQQPPVTETKAPEVPAGETLPAPEPSPSLPPSPPFPPLPPPPLPRCVCVCVCRLVLGFLLLPV